MTKKLIILLLAIAPMALLAQNVKIAHINSAEIFNLMPEVPAIETQLNAKQEEVAKNGKALVDEFNKKAETFQKNVETLSEAMKADQQKELEQLQERYQLFVQNSQKEQQEMYQKLVGPVQQRIAKAIKEVGDEKGYSYVFDVSTQQSPLVYINPTAEDATPLVKAKLGIKDKK